MTPHLFPPVSQTVPPLSALPLLEELVALHSDTQQLAGWRCLFIQHQLGDVCCQAQAMLALGIAPEDFFWAPVPYTAHPAMPTALCERTGVPAGNFFESTYTLRTNYDAYMKRVISEQILRVVEGMADGDRLLVVDDGAYFAAALAADSDLAARLGKLRVAMVEQTQRGIDKIERVGLPAGVPVVDVARSSPKKNIEPRYVAEAVARGTCRAIEAAAANTGDAVLLLGYGAIGRAVAQALDAIGMSGKLHVWDVEQGLEAQVRADGWTWWDRAGDTSFDYVIGCTGRAAFKLADLAVVRDGGMLVNAASGRHELPVDELLGADDVQLLGERDSILDGTDIHAPLHFMLSENRRVTVANGGLPITFCGDLNPTRPEKFDVTSCCMVYAAVQAVVASNEGLAGLVALDEDFCTWVTEHWARSEVGAEVSMQDNTVKPVWKKERLLRITWDCLGQLMDRLGAFVDALTPRPQVVVGIVRGGLCPALQVSHALGTRECYLLDVVRNTSSEGRYSERGAPQIKWDLPDGVVEGKDVILVDDIAGDGGTMRLTVEHLKKCGATNVRTAVLVRNQGCSIELDFHGVEVDDWVVFPWERQAIEGNRVIENLELSSYRRPDLNLRRGLTFDDVLLVPQRTRARSRADVSLATQLTADISLYLPFLSANAPWCTEGALAIAMARHGGMGFVHRMCSIEHQAKQIENVKASTVDRTQYPHATVDAAGKLRVGAAIGVNGAYMERAHRMAAAGSDVFVLDIAHGHADYALTVIKELKTTFPTIPVIAGNVATAPGTRDLILAGADAIKVGIGPGSACTTRIVTGAGVPQLTAVIDCVEEASKHGIPVIADGGLRRSGDVVKALAVGAATVMFGGMLAGTDESAAALVEHEGTRYKVTTGYASLGMKMTLSRERGEKISRKEFEAYAPEGAEVTFPYTGPAREVLLRCASGVRSGLSYSGSMSLAELVQKADLMRISAATQTENKPHMLSGNTPKLHREYRSSEFSEKQDES